MATNGNTNGGGSSSGSSGSAAAQRASLVQALDELAKGEQAAARLEAELGQFEARLDALLAAFGPDDEEADEEETKPAPKPKPTARTARTARTATPSAPETPTAGQPAAKGAPPSTGDARPGAAGSGTDKPKRG